MHRTAAEDEVDLLSLWAALVRWKYLTAGLLVAGFLAGAASGWLRTPAYESSAVLQVGRIGGLGRIQPTVELLQRLKHKMADTAKEATAPPAYLMDVKELADGVVQLTVRSGNADDSQRFLRAELDSILRGHSAVFEQAKAVKERARTNAAARIEALEQQASELDRRMESAGVRDAAFRAMLLQDRIRVTTEIDQLGQRIAALDLELSAIATVPSTVLQQPTLPAKPAGMKPMWFPLVGAIIGLLLGVALAVVLESGSTRDRDRTSAV